MLHYILYYEVTYYVKVMAVALCSIMQGMTFQVSSGTLIFSVAIYSTVSMLALAILGIRRRSTSCGNAELGGPHKTRIISAGLLVFLWIVYIVLSALKSYDHL